MCKSTYQEKFIYFLLIVTPFIDLLNGIFNYKLTIESSFSPGQIIRMILLLLLIIIYMKQKSSNLFVLGAFVFLFLFQEVIYRFYGTIDFKQDLLFVSKIWFNILLILFSKQYYSNNEVDTERVIKSIHNSGFFIAAVLIITKFLDIGVNSYGTDVGYKGLFMGLNDITAVLTMSMPFAIYNLMNSKEKLKNIIKFIIIFIALIMVGTKTGIVAALGILFYYITVGMSGKYKNLKRMAMIIIVVILSIVFFKYFYENYRNTILQRQKYFIENLDFVSYILSGRNELASLAFQYWNTNWCFRILGVGFTQGDTWIKMFIENHGMIEMDLLDILYFYGIPTFTLYVVILCPTFFRSIKESLFSSNIKNKTFYITFSVAVVISFLGGHVILSPLAGTYFAIIFSITYKLLRRKKNEKNDMYDRSK